MTSEHKIYQSMEYNVFISHSSKDEDKVKPLCEYLEDKGIKCFVSYRDIPSGVSYPGAITRAMRESEMLLLVLSTESNASTQVDRELTLANDQKKKMSCFRLEDIDYSDDKAYLMSGVNWLDAFPEPQKHYFVLLQDICRQLGREVPKKEETEEEKKNRYEQRLGRMLLAASQGNANAQHDLGRAYHEGNLGLNADAEEAYRWYVKAAKNGQIEAENVLGVFYAEGIFVEKNIEEAIKWYRIAALSGNEVAQSNLGNKYYFGEGVEKDLSQAVKWWRLAADQGYDNAQVRLGNCYYDGEGVDQDYEKAVKLYEQAVDQDNDWAQIRLAECYRDGKGVEKDIEKCIKLLEQAAENNSTDAMCELAKMYDYGEFVDANPEKAFYYAKIGAEKGDKICLWNLARYYKKGIGCEVNLDLYWDNLEKAANAGHPRAQDFLGDIYSEGEPDLKILPDSQKAREWYEKAIAQNYLPAMVDLALCYSIGGCLPLDDKKAAELFRQAAEAGDDRGQYFLSDEYQQGDGVEQDEVEAFNWCLKSAEQEYVPAMARIGEYYYYGFGTEQNFEKAVEWLQKASAEGEENAQYHLGLCYEMGYGVERSLEDALWYYYHSSQEKHQKAREAFDQLFDNISESAESNDLESLYILGMYYAYALEDYQKAVPYLVKAADQSYEPSYNELAWTYHLTGKYEEALPWAEKAVEAFPENPDIIDTLASVYQDLGRYDEALEQFELCLKLYKEQENATGISRTEEKLEELKKLGKKKTTKKKVSK